jgi:hypothetical protein
VTGWNAAQFPRPAEPWRAEQGDLCGSDGVPQIVNTLAMARLSSDAIPGSADEPGAYYTKRWLEQGK